MIKKILSNKQLMLEMLRFIIVGGVATLVDLGISSLIQYYIFPNLGDAKVLFLTIDLTVLVATVAGFSVSVIINYLLSLFFVFNNVDNKSKSRSLKGFLIFIVLAIIGFFINLIIKQIGNVIIPFETNKLWFAFIFFVATGIVLIYNYISRKFLLFKPKHNEVSGDILKENGQNE